jgi:hypothetical protein
MAAKNIMADQFSEENRTLNNGTNHRKKLSSRNIFFDFSEEKFFKSRLDNLTSTIHDKKAEIKRRTITQVNGFVMPIKFIDLITIIAIIGCRVGLILALNSHGRS